MFPTFGMVSESEILSLFTKIEKTCKYTVDKIQVYHSQRKFTNKEREG